MMTTWRSKICALVLSLAMVPGAFELMENATHLATEGHLAHGIANGDEHDPAGPEHGCTPLFHLCGCHAGPAFLGASAPSMSTPRTVVFTRPPGTETPRSGFWPSIDRPPRA